ncbi:hypothetical protein H0H93_006227 [Arthromyces matolae]|nr:hypothetical protein H0H93_006227 [Arthromyces matolae]
MLGWLNYYQKGYLQRDVSISNILKLKTPSHREPFTTRLVRDLLEEQRSSKPETSSPISHKAARLSRKRAKAPPKMSATADIANSMASMTMGGGAGVGVDTRKGKGTARQEASDTFWVDLLAGKQPEVEAVISLARQVEEKLKSFDLSDQCKAILNDCDMAAKIPGYFSRTHDDAISGTYEFQSTNIRYAAMYGTSYLHTPLDDFHSFFWTTVWASINNPQAKISGSKVEEVFRSLLSAQTRDMVTSQLKGWLDEETRLAFGISKFFSKMVPFLDQWSDILLVVEQDRARSKFPKDDVAKELWFHKYAYRVVLEYLKLLDEHKESLKDY